MQFQKQIEWRHMGDVLFEIVASVGVWRIFRTSRTGTMFIINGPCILPMPTLHEALRFIGVVELAGDTELWALNVTYKHSYGQGYFPNIELVPLTLHESDSFYKWIAPPRPASPIKPTNQEQPK